MIGGMVDSKGIFKDCSPCMSPGRQTWSRSLFTLTTQLLEKWIRLLSICSLTRIIILWDSMIYMLSGIPRADWNIGRISSGRNSSRLLQAGKTIFPILGIVLGAVIISAIVPLLMSRRTKKLPLGAERNYGAGGGAICPKCHRPFPLSLLTPHLAFSKIAICPYCGKLSLVRPEPIEKLRLAEKAELVGEKAMVPEETEEEKLKKEMDDSKYQGF